jgi:hypothetical protein
MLMYTDRNTAPWSCSTILLFIYWLFSITILRTIVDSFSRHRQCPVLSLTLIVLATLSSSLCYRMYEGDVHIYAVHSLPTVHFIALHLQQQQQQQQQKQMYQCMLTWEKLFYYLHHLATSTLCIWYGIKSSYHSVLVFQ